MRIVSNANTSLLVSRREQLTATGRGLPVYRVDGTGFLAVQTSDYKHTAPSVL